MTTLLVFPRLATAADFEIEVATGLAADVAEAFRELLQAEVTICDEALDSNFGDEF